MPVEFEAQFTPELLDEGARAFVRQFLARRYGVWLGVACLINLAGFTLALSLGASGPMLWFVGVVAIAGPAYLAWAYAFYSKRISERMQPHWLPLAHFTIGESELGVRTTSGTVSIPWVRVRAWLESASCIVLVLSPFAFVILPKSALSAQAHKTVSAKVPRYVV